MKTLPPIVHRASYTRLVEREINAWFAEAIFAPLQIILVDAGAKLSPAYQAIRFDEFGRVNSADDWKIYPASWGSLGIARKDMPQIPPEARGALTKFLEARGIHASEEWIRPDDLRPSQVGYYVDAVARAREKDTGERAILISEDGYVLDGHHRWTAARLDNPDIPIRCIRYDARIRALIRIAHNLPSSSRENAATSALEAALESGRIQYADGKFSGSFNSEISRELRDLGATFDKQLKVYTLSQDNTPVELRGILADAAQKTKGLSETILNTLTQMQANIDQTKIGIQFTRTLDKITDDLGKQLVTTTLSLRPEDIGITPQIDTTTREALKKDFTESTDLSIKNFAKERIPELRAKVEENAFKFGGRTDRLAKIIEAEFGVTKRKAEFLADQETGLLVSKYRKEKYNQIGITEYTWSTSNDGRVRKSHRLLNGRRFSFATGAQVSPPGQPARYCNPGEDYRCRCVPRPIINLADLAS